MAELTPLWQYSLDYLEAQLGGSRFPRFVQECEAGFQAQVDQVLAAVKERPQLDFIFISGPTSSGKTTFTNRLRQKLEGIARSSQLISLDDYYYEFYHEYDEMGRPDMESIDTLELSLLHSHLVQLAEGQEVIIPRFDFTERKRIYQPSQAMRLAAEDIILVEGLHALNAAVLQDLKPEQYLGIFIMPYAQFMHDKRTLAPQDMRKLRRCSRDVNQRGSSALATLDYWPAIQREEENSILAYLERADFYINSALAYEFTVIAPAAHRALQASLDQYLAGTLEPSDNVKPGLFYADLNSAIQEARRLSKVCELLPAVADSVVPEDSILQEFI